jgi:hypothetical protein
MIPVSLARAVLLVMSGLALLTATVLDGIMMRHFVQPILRLGERAKGGTVQPPRAMAFMFERAWARRIYHFVFAALLFAGWWYLGTEPGAVRWATMMNPPSR